MKKYLNIALYGLISWAIPFIASFPFFGPQGLRVDEFLFKSIMIIVGALTASFLLVTYFKTIRGEYIKEGLMIGVIWLLINWLLDVLILLPLSGMSTSEYIQEIGLRYLVIPIFSTAFGLALNNK